MSQFSLLFGNAWRRFTRLDGLARGTDPRSVLVLAAIAFSMPGVALAFFLAGPVVVGFRVEIVNALPVLHELAYYSGLLVALAVLLEWDALLPGAADGAVLAPLPVRPRRLVAAHGAALALLLAILTLVVNAPSLVLMPLLDWTFESPLRGMAHQAGAVLITAAIAFCSVLVLRALAVACSGMPGLRKLASMVQLAGLVAVVTGLLLLPRLAELGPAWQWGFESPLPLAPWALALALAAVGLYLLAAYRAFRPERQARIRRAHWPSRWRWAGSAPQAAIARFASLTLARCRRQRMIVGVWFAIGAAVVLASSMALLAHRRAPDFASAPHVAIAMPLVLELFLLAGLRNSFAVPVEVRANWIFRVCVDARAGDLTEAGRRLLGVYLAVMLLPVVGLDFRLWPAPAALAQLVFLAVIGAAWIQCLTWNLRKLPFTCSYQPGGAKLTYVWPFYAAAFYVGAFALADWEQWLLANRWRMAAALALLLAALAWSERRRAAATGDYQFEDDPEPVVQTLLAG